MRNFSAIIERCRETQLYVGVIPEIPGGHSQGATLQELQSNLEEVVSLLVDGDFTVVLSNS